MSKHEIVDFDPAANGWEAYTDEGFIGLVGPLWTRMEGDTRRFAFKAEHKHHNRRGVVQGGMLMTFADRTMGMTCWYAGLSTMIFLRIASSGTQMPNQSTRSPSFGLT